MKYAVIGLGEVGSIYASALLELGREVVGYDTVPVGNKDFDVASTAAEAVAGADVVLVMTSARAAPLVASAVAPVLPNGCLYADFTSASPQVMAEVAQVIDAGAGRFVDVAVLGPVSVDGAKTPLMLAGDGASALAERLSILDAPVEVLPDATAGDAMAHKLLRSVFMKGLAVVICEAVEAAEAAGLVEWTREQIANQLAGDGQKVIDHFLTGSRVHAKRRSQEMRDTASYLADLRVPNTMSTASAEYLERLGGQ